MKSARVSAFVAAAAVFLGGCTAAAESDGGTGTAGVGGTAAGTGTAAGVGGTAAGADAGSTPSFTLPSGDAGERLDALLAGLRHGSDTVTTMQIVELSTTDPVIDEKETWLIRRLPEGFDYRKTSEAKPTAASAADELPDVEIYVDGKLYARSRAAEFLGNTPAGVWFLATEDSPNAVLGALAARADLSEEDQLNEFLTDLSEIPNVATAVEELGTSTVDGVAVRGYRISHDTNYWKTPSELWVDDQWRVVRLRGGLVFTDDLHFSKFNEPVEIKAPAASEVYEVK